MIDLQAPIGAVGLHRGEEQGNGHSGARSDCLVTCGPQSASVL